MGCSSSRLGGCWGGEDTKQHDKAGPTSSGGTHSKHLQQYQNNPAYHLQQQEQGIRAQELRTVQSSRSNRWKEESPYTPSSSKGRKGYATGRAPEKLYGSNSSKQSSKLQSDQSPNDVLAPRNDSRADSDFESGSDSGDSDSDWDRFSNDAQESPEQLPMSARSVDARKRETSLFGVTEKRRAAPLKETQSLKLAKLRGCTFVNQYVVIKYLGRGACGRVFLCMDMEDNRLYAVKIVKKVELENQRGGKTDQRGRRRRNPIEDLKREVSIMRTLRHKNIVSLQEVVDDPSGNKMLLVMDYMEGGPVMTREALEKGRCIPEPLARQYFRDMCKALDYLHYNHVVHGDLKPENVLMSARGNVTLSDFGCSKVIISGNEYLERCNGTPAFLAPEMMKPHSRYRGRPTDVYALGACLFTFLYGRIPFNAPNVFKLFQVVQNEPLRFPESPQISEELKDLLLRMLAKNPKERITLPKMMKHPWVTRRGSWPLRSMKEMVRSGEDLDEPAEVPDLMNTFHVLDVPRQDHLHEVLRPGLPERVYSDGETLIRQGEQSTYMLYISEGQVEVTVKLATPRGEASSRAPESTSRRSHRVESDGDVPGATEVRSRTSRSSRSRRDDSQDDARSEASSRRTHRDAGDIIGDDLPPALLEGASKAHEFAATLGRGSREFLVAVRTEGQFVGEMAWFALGAVRCATIRAKGPVRVKIIPGERLDDIVNRVPEAELSHIAALQARQQVQEMVWMKQSENMVLEAMTRLSTVYDALTDLLSEPSMAHSSSLHHQRRR